MTWLHDHWIELLMSIAVGVEVWAVGWLMGAAV